MKRVSISGLLFLMFFALDVSGQNQDIDSEIAKNLKTVTSSSEFISIINQYLSIHSSEDIEKKEFNNFIKICRCINKKNIPVYQINTTENCMDFYFKKGRMVYSFSLEKKNNIYISNAKFYTFKNRRVKKQGSMAFK